ncbi:MaoC family dehydratase [Paenibacillus ihumii]|uniref:MaoC family dehydratase n=1 Tax=Paenibacillus ihumii TaxID=687436 RepID=UPI0006D8120D|nr:MaoC/PaaZ C-terminal domain-containing protein [Paenibacillus ihumii]
MEHKRLKHEAAAPHQRTIITKDVIASFLEGFPRTFRPDGCRVPVTFPLTLWQNVNLPWLPGDNDGKIVIHGQQSLQYHRALQYGEELIYRIRPASIRETKGSQGRMHLLDCIMELTDSYHQPLLQANTTLLLLNRPPSHPNPDHSLPVNTGRFIPPMVYSIWDTKSPLASGTVLLDVCLGTITKDLLLAYAAASGDRNPIHLDRKKAADFGLPGQVAHGMLILGMVGNLLQELETDNMLLSSLQCRFHIPIVEGDTVYAKAVVQSACPFGTGGKEASAEPAAAGDEQAIHCLLEIFITRPDASISEPHPQAAAPSSSQGQRTLAYSGAAVYVFV